MVGFCHKYSAIWLDVEAEVDHVAVLDHVLLALGAQLAGLLGPLLALAGDEVVVGDDLGADEAALEVGVDDPGRLGGARRAPGWSRRGPPWGRR